MMADDIPQWARDRVYDLIEAEPKDTTALGRDRKWLRTYKSAFARYIAEHEKPPVDPLLIEAREICAAHLPAVQFADGRRDKEWSMAIALDALKRGMELAREQGQ